MSQLLQKAASVTERGWKLNLQGYRDQVTLLLGNPPSAHPMMGLLDSWINNALRDLPQRTLPGPFDRRTLFPELTRQTVVQVVENQAWIKCPEFMLAPLEMFVYYSEDPPDLDFAQAHPVTMQDWETFQVLNRNQTDKNWTRLYSWFDDRLYLWPTPVAGTLGWISLFYLFEQPDMTVPEQEPFLNRRWDRAVTFLATAYGEAAQNHKERSAFFENEANKQVALAMNWRGMHEQRTPDGVVIYDDVSTSGTYD